MRNKVSESPDKEPEGRGSEGPSEISMLSPVAVQQISQCPRENEERCPSASHWCGVRAGASGHYKARPGDVMQHHTA